MDALYRSPIVGAFLSNFKEVQHRKLIKYLAIIGVNYVARHFGG